MDKNFNALIIEDHVLTSFALKTSLSTCKFIKQVDEANCAKMGLELVKQNKYDLIIMDIGLPDINGIEASRIIREQDGNIKIVILSSHCEKDEVEACLKIGINAYCSKETQPDKLITIIQDVLNGSLYFDASVAKYIIQSNTNTPKENNTEPTIRDCYNLTQQEKRVLILLATGNNNQQIAKKLKISINTTKVHVCSILQKMEVEDRTQAAIKAIRENLII